MGKKAASFFIEHKGSKVGPVSSGKLRELAAAGKISPETKIALVQETDDLNWIAAQQVKGLFTKTAAAAQSTEKIVVSCPCGKRFQAPSQFAERQVKCPGCQQPVQVPAASSSASSAATKSVENPVDTAWQEDILAAQQKGEAAAAALARAESGEPEELDEDDPLYAPDYLHTGLTTNTPIENHLLKSILVTLFCNCLLGLIALIFSLQVNGKLARGDREGASSASKTANLFCKISIWLTLVGLILSALGATVVFLIGMVTAS